VDPFALLSANMVSVNVYQIAAAGPTLVCEHLGYIGSSSSSLVVQGLLGLLNQSQTHTCQHDLVNYAAGEVHNQSYV
jgi:hypothetical protein